MHILIHIPNQSPHYIYGVERLVNAIGSKAKVTVVCQKKKLPLNNRSFLRKIVAKLKAMVSVELRHYRLARKKKQVWRFVKFRTIANLNQKYSRKYTYEKNKRLHEDFSEKTSNQTLGSLDILMVENLNNEMESINSIGADVLLMLGGPYIKKKILRRFSVALNLHLGWLPDYKGSQTVERAIISSDYGHIGASIHFMTNEMDGGNIIWRTCCDLDVDLCTIGSPHSNLFLKAFDHLPCILMKHLFGNEVNPDWISNTGAIGKTYYGFDFDYRFYKRMVLGHKNR